MMPARARAVDDAFIGTTDEYAQILGAKGAGPDGAELLLIALTGWGNEEDRRRSREAGIDHHLVKPVELNVLENLLAARHARQLAEQRG